MGLHPPSKWIHDIHGKDLNRESVGVELTTRGIGGSIGCLGSLLLGVNVDVNDILVSV